MIWFTACSLGFFLLFITPCHYRSIYFINFFWPLQLQLQCINNNFVMQIDFLCCDVFFPFSVCLYIQLYFMLSIHLFKSITKKNYVIICHITHMRICEMIYLRIKDERASVKTNKWMNEKKNSIAFAEITIEKKNGMQMEKKLTSHFGRTLNLYAQFLSLHNRNFDTMYWIHSVWFAFFFVYFSVAR